jgi:hypothetical protein
MLHNFGRNEEEITDGSFVTQVLAKIKAGGHEPTYMRCDNAGENECFKCVEMRLHFFSLISRFRPSVTTRTLENYLVEKVFPIVIVNYDIGRPATVLLC